MKDKILVLGANGNVGIHLVEELVKSGKKVKAASRSGRNVSGAEGVIFDYENNDSIKYALEDVGAMYLMAPTGTVNAFNLLNPVVDAAILHQVKIVLLTMLGADADEAIPYHQVERAVKGSGLPYVILRPNWFADNFHFFWKPGIDQGVISAPAGNGKSSFIDARDIAASAAAALLSNRFDGREFNLTGPTALDYGEAADIVGAVLGKPVRYEAISDEIYIQGLMSVGVSEERASFLAEIMYPVRQNWTAVVTNDVAELTGQAPRSFRAYAQDYKEQLSA
ncbi:SDR family oxidoreductase [Neokomagataea anthophila]|uniref:SDR family oxidoreductase n=1 Tax=Neokomagataea anthophila TaxID=2826925 RepID=A0ABS5E966_9PROT|nr:SDR family oxidoreductase [Neokomagataea anthophila]MBR0560448.1 SDR family oxidoreductase [Neokomagataea anthophila]